jgi:hypothetical protein
MAALTGVEAVGLSSVPDVGGVVTLGASKAEPEQAAVTAAASKRAKRVAVHSLFAWFKVTSFLEDRRYVKRP